MCHSHRRAPITTLPTPHHRRQNCRRNRHTHKGPLWFPPYLMASLLIAGLSIGAQKVQEKREKRKQAKATLAYEEGLPYEEARRSAILDAKEQVEGNGKKREAAEERERVEGGGSPPPPAYEEVVMGRDHPGLNKLRV